MATSPLAAALKTTVSGSEAADEKYASALQQLADSLENRQRLFDPQLLALAQGFAAPTQTGGFFESMGTAAGAVAKAQAEEEKENRERIAARLQLAQAEREQASLNEARKAFSGYAGIGPQAGGAPGAPGASGAPSGEFRPVSINDALAFTAQFPNQKELGARLMEAAKAGLDRYVMSMNGIVFDKMTSKYLNVDIPGQTQSDYATPYGTFKMLPNEYSRFTMAQKAGMGKEWMDAFKVGNQFEIDQLVAQRMGGAPQGAAPVTRGAPVAPPAPITPPAAGAAQSGAVTPPPSLQGDAGRKTVSEQEAASAAARERATKMASSEADRTNLVMDEARAARGSIAGYNKANEILADKEVQKHLGIFARGDVTSALGNLVSEAVKVGNFTIGLPEVKKIVRESGAPQHVIDKLSELAQIEAMWQMQSRKGLGSGTSVSNMEQMMANRVTPSVDDPYGAYKQKLAFLQEKDRFAIELSRELKRRNMTYDQFEDTPRFDEMFNAYQQRLYDITSGRKPQGSSGAITPGSLRDRLNKPK